MMEPIATRPQETVPGAAPLLRSVLGVVLRRIRRSQERTLAEVAADARVSMQYLSELERGRKEASSEILAAICRALRVSLADVLDAAGREFEACDAESAVVIRLGGMTEPAAGRLAGGPGLAPRRGPDAGGVVCLLAA